MASSRISAVKILPDWIISTDNPEKRIFTLSGILPEGYIQETVHSE